jgi:hypothetical protein
MATGETRKAAHPNLKVNGVTDSTLSKAELPNEIGSNIMQK